MYYNKLELAMLNGSNKSVHVIMFLIEIKTKPYYNFRPVKMFVGTSKEKFFYHNTLLCLVKAMQGHNITVELRNDSYVCGCVSEVDGFMNISLSNAVYCDPQGNEFAFENLFIHARNTRYVHIPEHMSILSTIKNEVSKSKKKPPPKNPTLQSRKAKKAYKLHMEVVASL